MTSMKLVEHKYMYWDCDLSPYWNKTCAYMKIYKSICLKKEVGVNQNKTHWIIMQKAIISYIYSLFVVTLDLSEKLFGGYGIDPFQYISVSIKRTKRDTIDIPHDILNKIYNDPHEKTMYTFMTFQELLYNYSYDESDYIEFDQNELDIDMCHCKDTNNNDDKHNICNYCKSFGNNMIHNDLDPFSYKNTSVDIFCLMKREIIQAQKVESKTAILYNPVTKYYMNHKENRESMEENESIRLDKNKRRSYKGSNNQRENINKSKARIKSERKNKRKKESSIYEKRTSSLSHATYSEFVGHLASVCKVIDLMDILLNLHAKHPEMGKDEFKDNGHKNVYKKIDSWIDFAQMFIIPVLFYSIWIVKSLCKNCERLSGFPLGPRDPNMRIFTENGFKGHSSFFLECNEEESIFLNDCLWRCSLKLGSYFNLFGISIKHTPLLLRNDSVKLTDMNMSHFVDYFVDKSWITSLDIHQAVSGSGEITYDEKYYKPIIDYSLSDIWLLINLISQKSCRLLDSSYLRIFLSLLWYKLYLYISSPNLGHSYSGHVLFKECGGYIFRVDQKRGDENNLIPYLHSIVGDIGECRDKFPSFVESKKVIVPDYDHQESDTREYNEMHPGRYENNVSSLKEETYVVTSQNLSKYTEMILSYIVELVTVSDYIHTVYPYRPPVLPSDDFLQKWVSYCSDITKDMNISGFIKKKFEEIYWSRNQFYGECEKYDISAKIAQLTPINSIMITNRYRHYEVMTKLLSNKISDIFDFAIDRISMTRTQDELKLLFNSCWDHHKNAILAHPPSKYMRDTLFGKMDYGSKSNNNERRTYAADDSKIKEDEEISELLKAIEIEKHKVALYQKSSSPFIKGSSAMDVGGGLIDIGNSFSNSGSMAPPAPQTMSIIERAMESMTSYKSVILEKEATNNGDMSKMDELHFIKKAQYIPCGFLEYNMIQEAILSVLSTRNNQHNSEIIKDFGILRNVERITDQDDAIFRNDKSDIKFTVYDSKDSVDKSGVSLYDKILVDHCLTQEKYAPDSSSTGSHMDPRDGDGIDEDESMGTVNNENGFSNNKQIRNIQKQYANRMVGSMLPLSYTSSFSNEGEENICTYFGSNDDAGSDYDSEEDCEEVDDEEYGYNAGYAHNSGSQSGHITGGRNRNFKTGQGKKLVNTEEPPKEWPEVMNYDALEIRSKREKKGLEYPLTILECSLSIKTHEFFKRSTEDKPCLFVFFNKYMICGGDYITSYNYPFHDPIYYDIKEMMENKMNDETEESNEIYERDDRNNTNDDIDHTHSSDIKRDITAMVKKIYPHKDIKEMKLLYATKLETDQSLGVYNGALEFAAALGSLIQTFEDATEFMISTFYEKHDISKMTIDDKSKKVMAINAFYRTFPEDILKNTLDYEREFNIHEKNPISKVQKD